MTFEFLFFFFWGQLLNWNESTKKSEYFYQSNCRSTWILGNIQSWAHDYDHQRHHPSKLTKSKLTPGVDPRDSSSSAGASAFHLPRNATCFGDAWSTETCPYLTSDHWVLQTTGSSKQSLLNLKSKPLHFIKFTESMPRSV